MVEAAPPAAAPVVEASPERPWPPAIAWLVARAPVVAGLVAVLLYLASLGHGFVLDDTAVIVKNSHVQRGIAGFGDILGSSYWAGYAPGTPTFYRPLSLLGFAFEQQLSDGPTLHHAVQIALYGLTTAMVTVLLRALAGGPVALLGGLLFAVHPVHVEVVANIKSRDELLALLFASATLWLAHRGRALPAAAAFAVALLAKESVLAFVLVLPVMLWLCERDLRLSWVTVPGVIVHFLLRGAATGTPFADAPRFMDEPTHNVLWAAGSATEHWGTVLSLVGRYTELALVPVELAFDYSIGQIPVVGPGDPFAILGLLVLVGLGALAWRAGRGPAAFGAVYLLLTYVVISNAFFRIAGSTMAERYLFTPSVGLCLLLALGLLRLPRPAALGLGGALIIAGAARSLERLPDWKSDARLFASDMVAAPGNPRIVDHFANVRRASPAPDTAELLAVSTGLHAADPERYHHAGLQAHIALCRLHGLEGRLDEATAACGRAVEVDPESFEAAFHHGFALYAQEDFAESAGAYGRAVELRQRSLFSEAEVTPMAVYTLNLGLAQLQVGDLEGARDSFERTVDQAPGDAKAWAGLALVAERQGRGSEAEAAWSRARYLDPSL